MTFKALLGILLATSYYILAAAEGRCNFPPDYLPLDLSHITQNAIYTGGQGTVWVYTDPFGNCSGCVEELSVCYVAYSTPNPMKVFAVDKDNTIVHVHSFTAPTTSTENQDTYCEPLETTSLCCSYQTLTPSEQFAVQSTDHYGVWYSEQIAFDAVLEEQGHYVTQGLTPLEVGVNINTSIHNIPKIYFHLIISPGPCQTNTSTSPTHTTSLVHSISTTSIPSSSSRLVPHTLGVVIASSTTEPRGPSPTTVLQPEPSKPMPPHLTTTGKEDTVPLSALVTHTLGVVIASSTTEPRGPSPTTVLQREPSKTMPPHLTTTGKEDTVAPIVVGASIGSTVLAVVAVVFITLVVRVVVKYRSRHPRQNKKSILPQEVNGHSTSFSNSIAMSSTSAGSGSNEEGNTICKANISKPIVIDSNPAYGTTSLDKDPLESSLPEQSTQNKPMDINSNPAYASSLQSNPAYGSSHHTMEMASNPAYASPGSQPQRDEIYSYIPNEDKQMQSLRSSVGIPTSLNEAYTSMAALEEEMEPGEEDEGYVINSPVYEEPEQLKMRQVSRNTSDKEVHQLISAEMDAEESNTSRMAETLTLNEAYITVNQATDVIAVNQATDVIAVNQATDVIAVNQATN